MEDLAKEASARETALKKHNEELKSTKEELLRGLKARDEVNIQYVERLLAAEKLLAKSHRGEEFEAMRARIKKEKKEREKELLALHEENDLLRRLNEALSIKIKDAEVPPKQSDGPMEKLYRVSTDIFLFLKL